MSKELENLEKLISFASVMSANMIGLSKGNYDSGTFIKKTYEYLHKYYVDATSELELERALKRLEAIDNANPSEALNSFDKIDNTLCLNNIRDNIQFNISKNEELDCKSSYEMAECLDSIKEVLFKALR